MSSSNLFIIPVETKKMCIVDSVTAWCIFTLFSNHRYMINSSLTGQNSQDGNEQKLQFCFEATIKYSV